MSVARWLETDSLSNQNISSALAIGAYTAAADRMIVCDVSLDQVAGSGDYVVYVTRQINGAGSAYVLLPKTTCTAASGETAIAMQSGPITVRSGDVLMVYVDGLAGDTTTPDTVVRWFEMATLRPDVSDRQLTVAATGEASANVTMLNDLPAPDLSGLDGLDGSTLALEATVQDILEDTGTTLPGLIAAGVSAGSGTGYYSDTVDNGTSPLDGVRVQLYTAQDRIGLAYEAYTNALGVFEMWPDPGVYYRWLDLAGYNFTQDVAVTVTEP